MTDVKDFASVLCDLAEENNLSKDQIIEIIDAELNKRNPQKVPKTKIDKKFVKYLESLSWAYDD